MDRKPSEDDLRQMFAYNKLFGASQAFLLYPGEYSIVSGEFYKSEENGLCGFAFVPFIEDGKLSSWGIERFADNLFNNLKETS